MKKEEIIAYFDRQAPTWDEEMVRSDEKIGKILDCGGVAEGKRILDVACGTGVLFPDYLKRGAASVTGIDISPEMAKIASEKFADSGVKVMCGDVSETEFPEKFDCVMIYNAFPHFPDPWKLFSHLAKYLAPGGRITVAHGMSRAQIDAHHHGSASHVSVGLMHETKLAELMGQWFLIDTVISDEEKYIVSGLLK